MAKEKDIFTSRMLMRQFIPSIFSAIILAISDMADAFVIGQKAGTTGLAAISLSLPVFMIINVLMHGFGIGGSIRFTKQSALGKEKEAQTTFHSTLLLCFGISVIISIFLMMNLSKVIYLLGVKDSASMLFLICRQYIGVIILGMPFFIISYILNYFLRSDNCEKSASVCFTIGNITDITLNILLVFVYNIGIAGAAYATLIGQIVSIVLYIAVSKKYAKNINLKIENINLKEAFIDFKVGLSTSIQYIYTMTFLFIINRMLMNNIGSEGVAVFDLIQNISFLIIYTYDGAWKASLPIISIYTSEHNQKGARKTLRLSMIYSTIIAQFISLCIVCFSDKICHIFGIFDELTISMATAALKLYCLSSVFAGISMLLEAFYQANDQSKNTFVLSTLRGAIILLPVSVFFSFQSVQNLWWLYPITEILSLIVFIIYLYMRKEKLNAFNEARVFRKTITSNMLELNKVLEDMEQFCMKWEAKMKQTYFVMMSVEEVCSAIIQHAFKDKEGYIQISLIAEMNGEFTLLVRDDAISFDPFTLGDSYQKRVTDKDMENVGMFVIQKKAKEFYYRRYQGFNSLVLRI